MFCVAERSWLAVRRMEWPYLKVWPSIASNYLKRTTNGVLCDLKGPSKQPTLFFIAARWFISPLDFRIFPPLKDANSGGCATYKLRTEFTGMRTFENPVLPATAGIQV